MRLRVISECICCTRREDRGWLVTPSKQIYDSSFLRGRTNGEQGDKSFRVEISWPTQVNQQTNKQTNNKAKLNKMPTYMTFRISSRAADSKSVLKSLISMKSLPQSWRASWLKAKMWEPRAGRHCQEAPDDASGVMGWLSYETYTWTSSS